MGSGRASRTNTGSEHVSTDDFDRRVHAVLPDGSEIVRYERAGKWWVEKSVRRPVSLTEAVTLAVERDAVVYSGKPGGGTFDARVRKLR